MPIQDQIAAADAALAELKQRAEAAEARAAEAEARAGDAEKKAEEATGQLAIAAAWIESHATAIKAVLA